MNNEDEKENSEAKMFLYYEQIYSDREPNRTVPTIIKKATEPLSDDVSAVLIDLLRSRDEH